MIGCGVGARRRRRGSGGSPEAWWDVAGVPEPLARYNSGDAASLTLSGSDVLAIANTGAGEAPAMFMAAAGRKPPVYTALDVISGGPALLYDDDGSASFLALPDGQGGIAEALVQELFVVMRYRDGTQTSFSGSPQPGPLMSGLAGLSGTTDDRIVGQGTANKWYSGNSGYVNFSSRNGGAFTNVALPTGDASIYRFSAAQEGLTSFPVAAVGCCYLGGSVARLASWTGALFDVIAYAQALTESEVASIESYLASYWGLP